MTEDQNEHLRDIQREFSQSVAGKYKKGANEHGGNLWEKPCINFLGDEILDFVVYYYTLKSQIRRVKALILQHEPIKAYNLLEYGNEEGIKRNE